MITFYLSVSINSFFFLFSPSPSSLSFSIKESGFYQNEFPFLSSHIIIRPLNDRKISISHKKISNLKKNNIFIALARSLKNLNKQVNGKETYFDNIITSKKIKFSDKFYEYPYLNDRKIHILLEETKEKVDFKEKNEKDIEEKATLINDDKDVYTHICVFWILLRRMNSLKKDNSVLFSEEESLPLEDSIERDYIYIDPDVFLDSNIFLRGKEMAFNSTLFSNGMHNHFIQNSFSFSLFLISFSPLSIRNKGAFFKKTSRWKGLSLEGSFFNNGILINDLVRHLRNKTYKFIPEDIFKMGGKDFSSLVFVGINKLGLFVKLDLEFLFRSIKKFYINKTKKIKKEKEISKTDINIIINSFFRLFSNIITASGTTLFFFNSFIVIIGWDWISQSIVFSVYWVIPVFSTMPKEKTEIISINQNTLQISGPQNSEVVLY